MNKENLQNNQPFERSKEEYSLEFQEFLAGWISRMEAYAVAREDYEKAAQWRDLGRANVVTVYPDPDGGYTLDPSGLVLLNHD